jgi:hypothetical protein
MGAKIGMSWHQIDEELEAIPADPLFQINEECDQVETTMQDCHLAMVFLLNSDKHWFVGV